MFRVAVAAARVLDSWSFTKATPVARTCGRWVGIATAVLAISVATTGLARGQGNVSADEIFDAIHEQINALGETPSASDIAEIANGLSEAAGENIEGTGLDTLLDGIGNGAQQVSELQDAAETLQELADVVQTAYEAYETGSLPKAVEAFGKATELAGGGIGEIDGIGTVAGPMLEAYGEALQNSSEHLETIEAFTKAKNAAIAAAGGDVTGGSGSSDEDVQEEEEPPDEGELALEEEKRQKEACIQICGQEYKDYSRKWTAYDKARDAALKTERVYRKTFWKVKGQIENVNRTVREYKQVLQEIKALTKEIENLEVKIENANLNNNPSQAAEYESEKQKAEKDRTAKDGKARKVRAKYQKLKQLLDSEREFLERTRETLRAEKKEAEEAHDLLDAAEKIYEECKKKCLKATERTRDVAPPDELDRRFAFNILSSSGLLNPTAGSRNPVFQAMMIDVVADVQEPLEVAVVGAGHPGGSRSRLTPGSIWNAFVAPFGRRGPYASERMSYRSVASTPSRPLSPMAVSPTLPSRAASSPKIEAYIISLGTSSGEAFQMKIFNHGDVPVALSGRGIVVEPLKKKAQEALQKKLQDLAGKASIDLKVDAYCLEFLREPPSPGMMFRIAGDDLQEQFEPMRRILRVAEELQNGGSLSPDTDPTEYGFFVKQWAVWTQEQSFDLGSFGSAFLDRTKKNFESARQPWTKEMEGLVRSLIPNRWNDIQKVLNEARAGMSP